MKKNLFVIVLLIMGFVSTKSMAETTYTCKEISGFVRLEPEIGTCAVADEFPAAYLGSEPFNMPFTCFTIQMLGDIQGTGVCGLTVEGMTDLQDSEGLTPANLTDEYEVFEPRRFFTARSVLFLPEGKILTVDAGINGRWGDAEHLVIVGGTDSYEQATGNFFVTGNIIENWGRYRGTLCVPACDDDCGECDGKVIDLTLQYNGEAPALIKVEQGKEDIVFLNMVAPAEHFTIIGSDKKGTLGKKINLWVNGVHNTEIHTSCSKPIGRGFVSGDFEVVEGHSLKGGKLCPKSEE
ncbi:MAG: hypothetical protein LWX54_15810 [Deltaproteobacteria bacterium]|nr:hypothetical protein [Deltaproteobacteria bacterium]